MAGHSVVVFCFLELSLLAYLNNITTDDKELVPILEVERNFKGTGDMGSV